MKCAHCLLVLSSGGTELTLTAVAKVPDAVTRVRGTAFCALHAVQKMSQSSVQAEMGIIPPEGV